MLTRMAHPDHGFTHAHDHAEIKKLEEHGWKKQTETEWKALLAAKRAKPDETDEAEEEITEAPKKRKYARKDAAA